MTFWPHSRTASRSAASPASAPRSSVSRSGSTRPPLSCCSRTASLSNGSLAGQTRRRSLSESKKIRRLTAALLLFAAADQHGSVRAQYYALILLRTAPFCRRPLASGDDDHIDVLLAANRRIASPGRRRPRGRLALALALPVLGLVVYAATTPSASSSVVYA